MLDSFLNLLTEALTNKIAQQTLDTVLAMENTLYVWLVVGTVTVLTIHLIFKRVIDPLAVFIIRLLKQTAVLIYRRGALAAAVAAVILYKQALNMLREVRK